MKDNQGQSYGLGSMLTFCNLPPFLHGEKSGAYLRKVGNILMAKLKQESRYEHSWTSVSGMGGGGPSSDIVTTCAFNYHATSLGEEKDIFKKISINLQPVHPILSPNIFFLSPPTIALFYY